MTPFASHAFRWVWASSLASAIATGLLRTATAWLAVGDGGGFGVGLVLAAGMLPNLLFGLPAGTLADRLDRTRQLLAVSLAAMPLMLALNRLAESGSVPLWQLVVLSFATGCLTVFDLPARQALVMDVVPRELAPSAMALNALATRLCVALGALLAGALIPLTGVAVCYLVVAAAYIISGMLVLAVPSRTSAVAAGVGVSFGQAIREGARLIVDVPAVRTLVVASVACEIFGFSFQTAVPVVARDVIGAGPEGLGTLNAATSIGGTLAVLVLAVLPRTARRERIMGLVFVVYGLSLLMLAATGSLVAAAVVLVVTGACAASFDLLQQTLLQLAVTEDQRGRAVGVWVLGIGSAPIGHLEMGTLIAVLGAPPALIINGLIVVVCAVILVVSARACTERSRVRARPATTWYRPHRQGPQESRNQVVYAEQAERWPTRHDDVRALFSILGRIRWRLGLEQTLLFGARGLMSAAIALTVLSLAVWLGIAPDLRTYAWLVCVPLAVAMGLAVLRWPSHRQAAIAADRRLVLYERLGTAVELARHPTGRFDCVQIRDAVENAQEASRAAFALDQRVRREALVAVAVVVLAGASVLLRNLPRPGVLTPEAGVAQTDTVLPAAVVDVTAPENVSEPTVAAVQPIEQSPADANLAARVEQAQAQSAAMDTLSKALGTVSAGQPAADAIQRGEFSQAHDQLASLGEEADQLSDVAKQQLSKALQQASSQTAAADPQLAARERQAGQALGRPNYNEQRQALNALADQVQRSGARSAPPDRLARDAGLLQQQAASQSAGQQAGGQSQANAGQPGAQDGAPSAAQQPGAGGGQQGPDASRQPGGAGMGTGTSPDVLGDQPSRLDSGGQRVEVPPKLGSGPGVRPPTGAEDQTGTDPTVGARSASELVQAQHTGQVAPEKNLVPGEQRPVIRGYFR